MEPAITLSFRRARGRMIAAPRAACLRSPPDPARRPGWRAALLGTGLALLLAGAAGSWGG